MKHFSSSEIPDFLGYKFVNGAILPRPIAWVSTLSKDGETSNVAPFSFFNAAGPNILTLSILHGPFGRKDTARNLIETKEAVVHLINPENMEEMNLSAASLPPDTSEITTFDIETVNSQTVKAPSIKNAPIRMEVKLNHHHVIEKDGIKVSDFFILEITDYFFDEAVFDEERAYILADAFQPVARLSGNDYALLGKSFELKRPQ